MIKKVNINTEVNISAAYTSTKGISPEESLHFIVILSFFIIINLGQAEPVEVDRYPLSNGDSGGYQV